MAAQTKAKEASAAHGTSAFIAGTSLSLKKRLAQSPPGGPAVTAVSQSVHSGASAPRHLARCMKTLPRRCMSCTAGLFLSSSLHPPPPPPSPAAALQPSPFSQHTRTPFSIWRSPVGMSRPGGRSTVEAGLCFSCDPSRPSVRSSCGYTRTWTMHQRHRACWVLVMFKSSLLLCKGVYPCSALSTHTHSIPAIFLLSRAEHARCAIRLCIRSSQAPSKYCTLEDFRGALIDVTWGCHLDCAHTL